MSESNHIEPTAPTDDVRHIRTAPSADAATRAGAEQLTLLTVEPDTRAHQLPTAARPHRAVHARFQLSRQTRERGLRHVAEIRRQLEAARTARGEAGAPSLPPRRSAA